MNFSLATWFDGLIDSLKPNHKFYQRVTLPFLTSGSLGSHMVTVLNQTLQLETLAFL